MRILAVSPMHDSSVCVVNNGAVESYYKEERLTGIKHDNFPLMSLQKCIENLKGPVDHLVFASPTNAKACRMDSWTYILKKYFDHAELIDMSQEHHLQHAALAKINSGWNECIVIVVDRIGSENNNTYEAETTFVFKGKEFQKIYQNFWDLDKNKVSICRAYEAAGTAMGVGKLDGGKVMGLSSYADKPADINIRSNSCWIEDAFKFGDKILDAVSFAKQSNYTEVTQENYVQLARLAYLVQIETQNALKDLVKDAIDRTGITKVCITGGYGLNIVANSWLTQQFPDVEFWFEPLADDSGNSLGAAMYLTHYLTDQQPAPVGTTFIHGAAPDYTNINVETVDVAQVAALLAQGNSVGIFQGLAEAGPRALGHRSLLFSPLIENARDIVNSIKQREWYRPFACAVLQDETDIWFEDLTVDKYMTRCYNASEYAKQKLKGVIHIDGTCRVQTVEQGDPLYDILVEFKKITGHGVLLNTSLNLAGDPLVETPEQAISMLNKSELNYMWFPEIEGIVQ
jgi:carbamoyltransferase